MNRHRTPTAAVEPVEARSGSEIRFPQQSGCHNERAHREENP